jgi:hypothetical protein
MGNAYTIIVVKLKENPRHWLYERKTLKLVTKKDRISLEQIKLARDGVQCQELGTIVIHFRAP